MSSIKYKAKFQQELNELYPMGKKKKKKKTWTEVAPPVAIIKMRVIYPTWVNRSPTLHKDILFPCDFSTGWAVLQRAPWGNECCKYLQTSRKLNH